MESCKIFWAVLIISLAEVSLNSTISLSFNYEKLFISKHAVTISWRNTLRCTNSVSYFLVKNFENSLNTTEIGNATTVTINRNKTIVRNNIVYKIYVEARSNSTLCGLSTVSLEILADVYTRKLIAVSEGDICLRPLSTHFNVIWPKSDNETDGSCICGLWTYISQCNCLQSGNYFGVHNTAKDGQIYICWSNITNNTIISVVFDSLNVNSGILIPSVNQEIYESYQVVIAEYPAPPVVEHNLLGLTEKRVVLCLLDIYDGNAPIQNYSISVTDITGYTIRYIQNKHSLRTCGNIPEIFSSCGPFDITVRSQNVVGYSKPNNLIIYGDEMRNVCKCISDNVNLTILNLNLSNPQAVVLKISCETQYVGNDTFSVDVELRDNTNRLINSTSVKCSTIFGFMSLQYSTMYSLDFKWISSDGMNCSLTNTTMFSSGPAPPFNTDLVYFGVSFIMIILMALLLVMCYWRHTLRMWIYSKKRPKKNSVRKNSAYNKRYSHQQYLQSYLQQITMMSYKK